MYYGFFLTIRVRSDALNLINEEHFHCYFFTKYHEIALLQFNIYLYFIYVETDKILNLNICITLILKRHPENLLNIAL